MPRRNSRLGYASSRIRRLRLIPNQAVTPHPESGGYASSRIRRLRLIPNQTVTPHPESGGYASSRIRRLHLIPNPMSCLGPNATLRLGPNPRIHLELPGLVRPGLAGICPEAARAPRRERRRDLPPARRCGGHHGGRRAAAAGGGGRRARARQGTWGCLGWVHRCKVRVRGSRILWSGLVGRAHDKVPRMVQFREQF
eukprot:349787-Chlamydomonas_euryale.AAC.1